MKRLAFALFVAASLIACKKKPVETPPPPPPVVAPMPAPVVTKTPEMVKTMAENFKRVHFELDSDQLSDDGKAALTDNAKIMQENPDIKIEVQGHADERGTTEYNLALGERRAETVKKYLVMQGVGGTRIATMSFGEEKPLDATSGEVAWSKNRRAEFRITWGGSDDVEGTTE